MKVRYKAFTLVELLVTIAIIGLLVGILVPALNVVHKQSKVAALRAAISSIAIGVNEFRNDQDKYPDSKVRLDSDNKECAVLPLAGGTDTRYADVGAHRLAEALFGVDMLGYNPNLIYGTPFYDVNNSGQPCDLEKRVVKREGPYVNIENLDIGSMASDVLPTMPAANTNPAWKNPNPVILDGLDKRNPLPILYYKANLLESRIHTIYHYEDNGYIMNYFGMMQTNNTNLDNYTLPAPPTSPYKNFNYLLWDTKTGITPLSESSPDYTIRKFQSGTARPYNMDSFVLISAGLDGEYGTDDDITNFQRGD